MKTLQENLKLFYLGLENSEPFLYKNKDLTTHALIIGMTGSGKTGLGITLLEEAAIDNIPSIIIDPKGDLTNLGLRILSLIPTRPRRKTKALACASTPRGPQILGARGSRARIKIWREWSF